MSNGKAMKFLSIIGLIRKILLYKLSQYFPRLYQRLEMSKLN